MSSERRARVAIVHPWFPQYRAPFFETLLARALEADIEIDVYYGDPPPEWRERGDSVTRPFARHLPTRFVGVAGKSLTWKSPGALLETGPYDFVIVEQAVRNLETYYLLARLGPRRIGFWGHGKSYTFAVSPAQERLKTYLTKRGAWFFGYTEGGVNAVVSTGYPRERTTVVANSVDATELSDGMRKVSAAASVEFAEQHDLRGKTALFVGGLDHAKRIEFLLEACETVARTIPDFRLLVAGNGVLRDRVVEAAASTSHVKYLGPVFGSEKYRAFAGAQVLAMPGRVGLVAVDSFATGRPIITTAWPYHAPEFEYLTPGSDSIVTADTTEAYARGLVHALSDQDALSALSAGASQRSEEFTTDRMAENFLSGLRAALGVSRRG